MDCNKFLENIVPVLDKEHTQVSKEDFEQHLSSCVACHKIFTEVAATYQIIDLEKNIPDNPFFYHKLITRIEADNQKRTFGVIMRVLKPLAVAASIALGIIIGNGELAILDNEGESIELATENLSLVMPADYSVWTTLNEDNGSEN